MYHQVHTTISAYIIIHFLWGNVSWNVHLSHKLMLMCSSIKRQFLPINFLLGFLCNNSYITIVFRGCIIISKSSDLNGYEPYGMLYYCITCETHHLRNLVFHRILSQKYVSKDKRENFFFRSQVRNWKTHLYITLSSKYSLILWNDISVSKVLGFNDKSINVFFYIGKSLKVRHLFIE